MQLGMHEPCPRACHRPTSARRSPSTKHTAAADSEHDRHDRWLSVVEALLLSPVAVLAAYSGYAAAKWGHVFLVGISGHFRTRQAGMALIGAGGSLLAFAVIQLLGLPGPPA
jgi:hypothetical protein